MLNASRFPGPLKRAALVVLVSVVFATAWVGFQAWGSWRSVERLAFDTGEARRNLEPAGATTTTLADSDEIRPAGGRGSDDVLSFLIVGSDQRSDADLSRRADVILMFVLPPGGADPLLFSIPRDLYLPNPCSGGMSRVNANLNGCGSRASGPEQLAVVVEDFTGIEVDHFAVFDFDGFRTVIDRIGGIDICVERPVYDGRSGLDLPAGCTRAKGEQALAWVRSRHTQEFIGGVWRTMPDVNDLERNQRQQDMVLQALARLKTFRNVSELSALVDDLAGAFIVDEHLRLSEAASLAWSLRNLDTSRIVRLVIPTRGILGPRGEALLSATEPFEDTLRAAHPDADAILAPTPAAAPSTP